MQRLLPSAAPAVSTYLGPSGSRLLAAGVTGTQVIDLDDTARDWEPYAGSDGDTVLFALGAPDGRG